MMNDEQDIKMRTSVEAYRIERTGLFQRDDRTRRRPAHAANTTVSEAAAIQQSLSRTQTLLKSELARVAAVQNAIKDDEHLLRKTIDTHKTLNVAGAKRALTELERAELKERRVLLASIIFFWTVIFYIVWCRILIRLPLVDHTLSLLMHLAQYIVRHTSKLHVNIIQLVH
jgi:hypothetical protein